MGFEPTTLEVCSCNFSAERCPGIGFLSRGDREIGVLRNVEPPRRPRLEPFFPRSLCTCHSPCQGYSSPSSPQGCQLLTLKTQPTWYLPGRSSQPTLPTMMLPQTALYQVALDPVRFLHNHYHSQHISFLR